MSSGQGTDLRRKAFEPVDGSFLFAFRIFFGAVMLWTAVAWFVEDYLTAVYVAPPFHFTFHGFSWVRPWPGPGMYIHGAVLAAAAALVMVGLCYRVSASVLFLAFTYAFLLEKAVYLNHHYLMVLLCFLLVFLPAHRGWSIDAWLRPSLKADVVPAWYLWLLRFQIGLPYVMGGIAKLNSDWLAGQPMQTWLSISVWRVLLGPVAEEPWLALLFSWGGLVFDLTVVPLLLWRPTRAFAFAAAVIFHLMNAFMFDIGVFPWLMIGATAIFFPPDWPRRLLAQRSRQTPSAVADGTRSVPATFPCSRAILILAGVYVGLHLLLPFRCWLYPGNVLWTEEGHMFSWRMMLAAKVTGLRFVVVERTTGKAEPKDVASWLTRMQLEKMGHDPEMMREFAHFLRAKHEEEGKDVAVHVLALCSLNGRKPQLVVDPMVDLSREPRRLGHQPYVVPLREPFRRRPWDVPVSEWDKVLSAPPRQ
jgi:hypothetical protein